MLLTTRPLTGHVQPLRPLAAAAASRGHEVAFATGEPVVSRLREGGLQAFAAGRGYETRAAFDPRAREVEGLDPEERREVFFAELFVGIELEPRLDDLVRVIEEWRPDVVLHEAAELAGPIAATLAGIPYVTVGYGALLPPRLLEAGAAAAAPHWRARGLEPPPHGGLFRHLYVDPFPPSLQRPGGVEVERQPARLTPLVAGRDAAPAWLTALPRQPTVYASFGTVWNRRLDLFQARHRRRFRSRGEPRADRRRQRRPGGARPAAAARAGPPVRPPGGRSCRTATPSSATAAAARCSGLSHTACRSSCSRRAPTSSRTPRC